MPIASASTAPRPSGRQRTLPARGHRTVPVGCSASLTRLRVAVRADDALREGIDIQHRRAAYQAGRGIDGAGCRPRSFHVVRDGQQFPGRAQSRHRYVPHPCPARWVFSLCRSCTRSPSRAMRMGPSQIEEVIQRWRWVHRRCCASAGAAVHGIQVGCRSVPQNSPAPPSVGPANWSSWVCTEYSFQACSSQIDDGMVTHHDTRAADLRDPATIGGTVILLVRDLVEKALENTR